MVPYTKYKIKKKLRLFLSEALANPRKKANVPQVKTNAVHDAGNTSFLILVYCIIRVNENSRGANKYSNPSMDKRF